MYGAIDDLYQKNANIEYANRLNTVFISHMNL